MAGSPATGALRPLTAIDSFDMFAWLQGPYAEVAAALDFTSLSTFEQWERLHHYVEKVGYLLGKKNLATLDEVNVPAKIKLLAWLDENYRRSQAAPPSKVTSLASRRLLHSKI